MIGYPVPHGQLYTHTHESSTEWTQQAADTMNLRGSRRHMEGVVGGEGKRM